MKRVAKAVSECVARGEQRESHEQNGTLESATNSREFGLNGHRGVQQQSSAAHQGWTLDGEECSIASVFTAMLSEGKLA